MIIPRDVLQRFSDLKPFVDVVSGRVRDTVLSFCEERGFAFLGRPKSAESVAEKIETGRYEKWGSLDDLFACTVVIPTLVEENEVLEFLRLAFAEVETRERGASQKAPEVFRFDATRFIGRLRHPDGTRPGEPIYDIAFEVQVRSAFEHAWSVATHSLVYKANAIDWRRLRVAAQLKAAVEQLDSLVLAFESSAQHITESEWPEVSARARVVEFFRDQIQLGHIPPELAAKDWSRFGENVYRLVGASLGTRRAERISARIAEVLPEVETEIRSLTPARVPRSVSLFQLVLGVLAEKELLGRGLQRGYFPVITSELVELFPAVNGFNPRFDFAA